MTNGNSSASSSQSSPSMTIPPFHSLPFSAYYRTECQDKYSTSKLAHRVAYIENECASSLQLTPCLDESPTAAQPLPSYNCQTFVHGHQYARKVRCFGPWVDAAGFANTTLSEISKAMNNNKSTSSSNSHNAKKFEHASKA